MAAGKRRRRAHQPAVAAGDGRRDTKRCINRIQRPPSPLRLEVSSNCPVSVMYDTMAQDLTLPPAS